MTWSRRSSALMRVRAAGAAVLTPRLLIDLSGVVNPPRWGDGSEVGQQLGAQRLELLEPLHRRPAARLVRELEVLHCVGEDLDLVVGQLDRAMVVRR